jgi:hypothetical protein
MQRKEMKSYKIDSQPFLEDESHSEKKTQIFLPSIPLFSLELVVFAPYMLGKS